MVEEWVANVVEHGRAPPGSLVLLTFERRGREVRLSASDAGRPFDPRTAPDRGPNLRRGGGAGIALIRAWCRVEAWRRARGRNRVTLLMNP